MLEEIKKLLNENGKTLDDVKSIIGTNGVYLISLSSFIKLGNLEIYKSIKEVYIFGDDFYIRDGVFYNTGPITVLKGTYNERRNQINENN